MKFKLFALMGVVSLAAGLVFAEDAATLFNSKCASCHGKDGKGNPSMSKVFKVEDSALDLTDGATLGKSDDELNGITAKGSGKMPAYEGKIQPADIAALTAHSRKLAGGQTAKVEAAPAAGADKPVANANAGAASGLYQSKCASCHGKDGKGNPAMANVFKVDKSALDLSDQGTQAKSGADLMQVTKKGMGKMPAYEGKLKDDEINSLTAHIKSLGGK
jgi:cytochrome c6